MVCEKEKNRVKTDIFQVVDSSSFFSSFSTHPGIQVTVLFLCQDLLFLWDIKRYIT